MVNLRVYSQSGDPYYIDLYETEPIKLNFSIEDITNTDAKSTFSRVFRVPSTTKNNEFFAMAFLIEGIDFDVTVKVPAEIEVGGALFRAGHIRLQNIYVNQEQGRTDYELLFLGETRDFSSLIGEAKLCDLDGSGLTHILNYSSVVQSWQAYPQGTSASSGLFAGDLLYPLVDHGNTYNGSGVPQEAEIKTVGSNRFTQNSHPLTPERFKPMIRVKKVIDLIFAQTPYTYTSTFLTSQFFKKLYISAWGNQASIYAATNQTEQLCNVNFPGIYGYTGVTNMLVPLYNELYDPGGNFNQSPFPAPGHAYIAPLAGSYTFTVGGQILAVADPFTGLAYGTVEIWVNGAPASSGASTTNGYVTDTLTISLNPGDYVQMYVTWSPNTDFGSSITDADFTCTAAPGLLDPTFALDCNYKQLDFLRDVLKLFRCVMAPDKDNPNNFIIEPWVYYVASGDTFDWSSKVDRTVDFQIEPLFYTQTDEIKFLFSQDEDYLNKYNQDAYKQVYGQLEFDSGNELLTGTRDVTVGFAPTPTIQIEGDSGTSSWIIPQIHTHETEGGNTVHLPIKPVTRILFYNGLLSSSAPWYITDGTTTYTNSTYPQVSYQEGGPPITSGLNLNWDRWFAYYGNSVPGWSALTGQSLFERYWSSYIGSLYNKFARRVTCNVILNSVDLQDFSFDDVIFIDGVYYIPEKIIDAPIGQKESVKVQLIKLLDYKPGQVITPPVEYYYYEITQTDCLTNTLQTWTMQSTTPLQPGDWVGVQGNSNCYVVIGPAATQIWDYVFEQEYIDCPTCNSQGPPGYVYYVEALESCLTTTPPQLTVTTAGPLSIGDTVGLTTYTGCWRIMGPSYLAPQDTIAVVYIDCPSCLGGSPEYTYQFVNCVTGQGIEATGNTPLNLPGATVTIVGQPGCWEATDTLPGTYPVTYSTIYTDCAECLAANPQQFVYDLQDCATGTVLTVGQYAYSLTPGQAVLVDALPGCWEVIGTGVTPLVNITQTYPDCQTCDAFQDNIITEIVMDPIITETSQNIITE